MNKMKREYEDKITKVIMICFINFLISCVCLCINQSLAVQIYFIISSINNVEVIKK